MTVTKDQAEAITMLALAVRPSGAPRWDGPGIMANVRKVADRSLGAVVIAVMQAAEDRNAATPGVISKPGPHWRNPESAPAPEPRQRFDPRLVCNACGQSEATCRDARDHPFLSVERARGIRSAPVPDTIREAIAARKHELCSHGVPPMNCADHRPTHPTPGDLPGETARQQ